MSQTTSKFRVIRDSSIYNNTKCSSYGDDVLMVDTSGGIYLGNNTSTPDLIANVSNVQAVDIEGAVIDDVAIELIPLTNGDIDLIWNKYFNEGGYGSGSATAVDEVINSVGVGDYDEEIL